MAGVMLAYASLIQALAKGIGQATSDARSQSSRVFAMRFLVLILVSIFTAKVCEASLRVPKSDWEDNAAKIIELRNKSRSEEKFMEQFGLYNGTIIIVWAEIHKNKTDRTLEIRLALVLYLNSKLCCQYVFDHPKELQAQREPARDFAAAAYNMLRQYDIPIDEDFLQFQWSFRGNDALVLRSLATL